MKLLILVLHDAVLWPEHVFVRVSYVELEHDSGYLTVMLQDGSVGQEVAYGQQEQAVLTEAMVLKEQLMMGYCLYLHWNERDNQERCHQKEEASVVGQRGQGMNLAEVVEEEAQHWVSSGMTDHRGQELGMLVKEVQAEEIWLGPWVAVEKLGALGMYFLQHNRLLLYIIEVH